MCIGSDRVCIEQQMLRLHRDRLNVLLRGVDYLMLGEGFGQTASRMGWETYQCEAAECFSKWP